MTEEERKDIDCIVAAFSAPLTEAVMEGVYKAVMNLKGRDQANDARISELLNWEPGTPLR